jgi:hypothetical protein
MEAARHDGRGPHRTSRFEGGTLVGGGVTMVSDAQERQHDGCGG